MRRPTGLQHIFPLVKKIDGKVIQASGQLHLGVRVERGSILCNSKLSALHNTRLVDLRQLADAVVTHGDYLEVIIVVLIHKRFFTAFAANLAVVHV